MTYILSYELVDDPMAEHELTCDTTEEAMAYVDMQQGLLVWWVLTDSEGNLVASS